MRHKKLVKALQQDIETYCESEGIEGLNFQKQGFFNPMLSFEVGGKSYSYTVSRKFSKSIKDQSSAAYEQCLQFIKDKMNPPEVEDAVSLASRISYQRDNLGADRSRYLDRKKPFWKKWFEKVKERFVNTEEESSELDRTKCRIPDYTELLELSTKVKLSPKFDTLYFLDESYNEEIRRKFDNSKLQVINKLDEQSFKMLFEKPENKDILFSMSTGEFFLTLQQILKTSSESTDNRLPRLILNNLKTWYGLGLTNMQYILQHKDLHNLRNLILFSELGKDKFLLTKAAFKSKKLILRLLAKNRYMQWKKMNAKQMRATINALESGNAPLELLVRTNFSEWISMLPQQMNATIEAMRSGTPTLLRLVQGRFMEWKDKHENAMRHIYDILCSGNRKLLRKIKKNDFDILFAMNPFQLRKLKEAFLDNNGQLQEFILANLDRKSLKEFTRERVNAVENGIALPLDTERSTRRLSPVSVMDLEYPSDEDRFSNEVCSSMVSPLNGEKKKDRNTLVPKVSTEVDGFVTRNSHVPLRVR